MDASKVGVEPRTPWRSWYALGLLLVAYIFNFLDRSILGILNEPIRRDLGLSDTQMGLLGGIAFAAFYTLLGIPIARLADRSVRRNILAASLALWSGMTVVCGFATSFVHLLLARIGVGIGEAGGTPPSHSMITDLFPPHRRATALGVYALGIPIGGMIGVLLGGWLNEVADWRTAFLIVGAPGVVLAGVVMLTLAEPKRGAFDAERPAAGPAPAMPSVGAVFRFLWLRRSFRYMVIAASLHGLVGYGVSYWAPTFLIRSHHMGTGEIGRWLFLLGFAPVVGTLLGGYLTDRLHPRDARWYVWVPGLATVAALPFSVFFYLLDDHVRALLVAIGSGFFASFYLAPAFAMTQSLARPDMRAQAASIFLFVSNLIGLGLGPQVVGILSDVLNRQFGLGEESLRWALVAMLPLSALSAAFYFASARSIGADLSPSGAAGKPADAIVLAGAEA